MRATDHLKFAANELREGKRTEVVFPWFDDTDDFEAQQRYQRIRKAARVIQGTTLEGEGEKIDNESLADLIEYIGDML